MQNARLFAIFCASLGLLAVSPVQAQQRDGLPMPAPQRAELPRAEQARPCPELGPGFFRLPGSETCVRLSGRVEAEAAAGGRVGASNRP